MAQLLATLLTMLAVATAAASSEPSIHIMAQARSGSTTIAAILSHIPRVFYLFEPFHGNTRGVGVCECMTSATDCLLIHTCSHYFIGDRYYQTGSANV